MIHKNLWRPDTCDCEIEYEWDDTQDENTRVHTVSRIIRVCPIHTGLQDKFIHFNKVVEENQRKNIVYGKILDNITTAIQEIITPDGQTVKTLKPGLEYKWSFDKDRNLEIDLVGFTAQQKNSLSAIIGTLYGNKVKVK